MTTKKQRPDHQLFARIKELTALRQEFAVAKRKYHRLYKKVGNDPRCPKDITPATNPAGYRQWQKLSHELGYDQAFKAGGVANRRQGKALLRIMRTRATTLPGLLAKLRVAMLVTDSVPGAYDAADQDLAVFNETGHPLAQFVADDLARMVARERQ